jgi:hypothetical protein
MMCAWGLVNFAVGLAALLPWASNATEQTICQHHKTVTKAHISSSDAGLT